MIKEIMAAVSIPVMAKVRIGHFVEAQILQAVGVDYIDVSHNLSKIRINENQGYANLILPLLVQALLPLEEHS